MPIFTYEGRDTAGQILKGQLSAPDQRSALETLRAQGLLLQKLEVAQSAQVSPKSRAVTPIGGHTFSAAATASATAAPAAALGAESGVGGVGVAGQRPPRAANINPTLPSPRGPASPTIPNQPMLRANSRDLALFYRQLGALVNAGTGLGAGLHSMAQNASGMHLRQVAAQLAERIQAGEPLALNMNAFPGVFSPLHVGIVSAGERGGFLDASFARLARYCERDYEIQQTIKRETWYPKLLVFASIFIPSVVPLVLQGFIPWLRNVVPPLLLIGAVWWALKVWKMAEPTIAPNNPVRLGWDRFKLIVPIGGKVARGLATARFCRALAALYAAGVGIGESVRLSANACGNAAIKKDLLAVIPRLEQGESISSTLTSTRHFPNLAMQMMAVGEQSGDMDSSLDKAADFLEGDAETAIRQALPVLGILAFLIVAGGIGMQVIHMYQGMISTYDGLMNDQ